MLFSIVIPSYNASQTIKKCLDSVLGQDFSDYETIVVNDASTDKTEEVIDQYMVDQYNIKQTVLEKNLGPAGARNVGIKKARGEIIVFIDSDVTFKSKNALSELAKIFKEKPEIDGVIMIKDKIPLNKGVIPLYIANYKYYLWNQPGEYQTSFTTERSAIKKDIFNKFGYFNQKYKGADVEDFEFGYRLAKEDVKIYIARNIRVGHHFETFKQLTKKTLKRSWQWVRLFLERKRFDPVYSTKERGIKTLFGAINLALLILSVFIPALFYFFLLFFLIYLFYNLGFYKFIAKEKKIHWLPVFILLDLYFCFLTALGAGFSIIFYPFRKKYE